MKNQVKALVRALGSSVLVVLAGAWLTAPVQAANVAKVQGTITDNNGKPLAKVQVYFQNSEIALKRYGPVKTKKNGRYIYPFLDLENEPKYKIEPKLPGYKILKMSWKLVDSQRQDRGSNTIYLNAKQEVPAIRPVLIGSSGTNTVDFVMVKDADFVQALRQAVGGKQGSPGAGAGTAAGSPAAPPAAGAGTEAAPPPPPTHTISEALGMVKAGKNDEAIPILKDYLDKSPNNAPLQMTLGKVYILTKQYQEAIPHLTKALEVNANQPGAHFYLGIAHAKMGQDEEAIKDFQAEIPISPSEDASYSNLATIYEKQGKLDEAIDSYKKAVEIKPDKPELHAALAQLYEKKGDQAKAAEEYQALTEIDPGHAAVTWYNLGAIAKNNDKNADAINAFKKAVELDPKYAQAHRELGYALVQQGDFAGAVSQFKKYLELAPDAADAADIKNMVRQLSK